MSNRFFVIDDERANAREAFVTNDAKHDECMRQYSGYVSVRVFNNEEDAQKFCTSYNNYEGCETHECTCCTHGCTMSAYEYAHWNGQCAYTGT